MNMNNYLRDIFRWPSFVASRICPVLSRSNAEDWSSENKYKRGSFRCRDNVLSALIMKLSGLLCACVDDSNPLVMLHEYVRHTSCSVFMVWCKYFFAANGDRPSHRKVQHPLIKIIVIIWWKGNSEFFMYAFCLRNFKKHRTTDCSGLSAT